MIAISKILYTHSLSPLQECKNQVENLMKKINNFCACVWKESVEIFISLWGKFSMLNGKRRAIKKLLRQRSLTKRKHYNFMCHKIKRILCVCVLYFQTANANVEIHRQISVFKAFIFLFFILCSFNGPSSSLYFLFICVCVYLSI
jgi:hypothetical protein